MVLVGAKNVGKISLSFLENKKIEKEKLTDNSQKIILKENLVLGKGKELAKFELGSTVLLFFKKDTFKYLNKKSVIKIGDTLEKIY